VIIISAKLEVYNRIELFKIGADDYITKPFDIDEVMLRIQAVLRRTGVQTSVLLTFRDIKLDTDSKRVYVKGNEITCTATEYAILELMLKNPKFPKDVLEIYCTLPQITVYSHLTTSYEK
ncbi:MAG: response regulator transcription factor, partial [Oscillospiraceae bacterium]|nr:response regulator transcription factor [Oscillospiraceae bacterium]